jgi:hypothetical protein
VEVSKREWYSWHFRRWKSSVFSSSFQSSTHFTMAKTCIFTHRTTTIKRRPDMTKP